MMDDNVISLFSEPSVTMEQTDDSMVRIHWFNYECTTYEDPISLFNGFQEMKIISFSYNFGFIAKLAEQFEHAEIILGAQFIAEKINKTIASQMVDVMATMDTLRCNIHKNKKLAKRIVENEVEIRCPNMLVDHRKIYLLKADDGRTRVIIPSANISARAWSGNFQLENFAVSDDPATYEAYIKEFNMAWDMSVPVVPNAIVENAIADTSIDELPDTDITGEESKQYEVAVDNPLLERARSVDTAVIVREVDDTDAKIKIIEYNKDEEYYKQHHSEILKNMKLTSKKGAIVFTPTTIQKYIFNSKKASQKKVDIEKVSERYPRMVVDYSTGDVYLNKEKISLSPPDEDVKNDVHELLMAFSNFDNFVGKVKQAKENHFKLMNVLFSSPFNAKLRCSAYLQDIDTSGLPLYVLLNSPANCGKTFMVRYFLKMMTGNRRLGYKSENVKSGGLTAYQTEEKVLHKGIPIFIDEVISSFKTTYGGMIRNADSCEDNLRETQPLTVFASNVVSDPEEALRKRMVFLSYDIGLSSSVSRREYQAWGRQFIRRIGTAFYRKYLSYMVPYVMAELDKIETKMGITDKYSPELMQKSSEIIMQIIKESGFTVPDYMKVLTWDTDYADNSKAVYDEPLEKIIDLYNTEKKLFKVDEKYVTISLSNDWTGQKIAAKWISLLPREIYAEKLPDASCVKIRMNRKELEQHIGFRFDSGIVARVKNLFS